MKNGNGTNSFCCDIKLPSLKARAFDLSVELARLRGASLTAAEYLNQTLGAESEIDGVIGLASLEYEVLAAIALMELAIFNINTGLFDVDTTNLMMGKVLTRHLFWG